jgi:hypothetical protein
VECAAIRAMSSDAPPNRDRSWKPKHPKRCNTGTSLGGRRRQGWGRQGNDAPGTEDDHGEPGMTTPGHGLAPVAARITAQVKIAAVVTVLAAGAVAWTALPMHGASLGARPALLVAAGSAVSGRDRSASVG